MELATGRFEGRGGHELRGTFNITRRDGGLWFATSEDFFFDGSPEPGFALSASGDPTQVEAVATRFLTLPGTGSLTGAQIEVTGRQEGPLPDALAFENAQQIFLWCFQTPFLLGIAQIERVVEPVFLRDDDAFLGISEGYVRTFVRELIRNLAGSGKVEIEGGLNDEDRATIFDTAFNTLITLDTPVGHAHAGRRHPVIVSFADFSENDPSKNPFASQNAIYGMSRSSFHGAVSFEMIDEEAAALNDSG